MSVADPKIATITCPVTTLAPGASTTCTGRYTLTQADVDAGHVSNTATATGIGPTGPGRRPRPTATTRPLTAGPGDHASTSRRGTPSGNTAGSTIPYTFVVTNTGNVTLTGVGVTDPKVGPVTCPAADAGAGRVDDLHRDLHAHPGRRRRRARWSTPPPSRHAADRRGGRRPPTASTTPITAPPAITLDKQAGTPTGHDRRLDHPVHLRRRPTPAT